MYASHLYLYIKEKKENGRMNNDLHLFIIYNLITFCMLYPYLLMLSFSMN